MAIFVSIILLFYMAVIFWLVLGIDRNRNTDESPVAAEKITVIIAVRNERQRLPVCLQALRQQDYDKPFGVLIADDHSTDGTVEWAENFVRDKPEWRVIRSLSQPEWASSKKTALSTAIVQAKSELLLFTDADCVPPVQWLKTMVGQFSSDTVLVAGFSPQLNFDRSLWSDFLLVDSLSAALAAAGTMGRQNGVTATGRNLAYRLSAWQRISGFSGLPNSISGDDDFITQQLCKTGRIRYCLSPGAVVPAQGPQNWRKFLQQKQRHLSSGRHYSPTAQLVYGLYHSLNIMLWLSFIAGFFISPWMIVPLIIKWLTDGAALLSLARPLKQDFSLSAFMTWQILFVIYHGWAACHRFHPPRTWHGSALG